MPEYYSAYNKIDPDLIGLHDPRPLSSIEETVINAQQIRATNNNKKIFPPGLNIFPFVATPELDLRLYWNGLNFNDHETENDFNRVKIGFDAHFESTAITKGILILLGRMPEIPEALKLSNLFKQARLAYPFEESRIGIIYPKDPILNVNIPFIGSVWAKIKSESQNLHYNMHSFREYENAIMWVRDGKLREQ